MCGPLLRAEQLPSAEPLREEASMSRITMAASGLLGLNAISAVWEFVSIPKQR